jgi:hypothetical protein
MQAGDICTCSSWGLLQLDITLKSMLWLYSASAPPASLTPLTTWLTTPFVLLSCRHIRTSLGSGLLQLGIPHTTY